MFNWTILSSGDRDLLHVALSTAAFINILPEAYRRFQGTPDKKQTLISYLCQKQSDPENIIDMAIHDRMKMKRFHRFSVPDYFYLEGYVKGLLQLQPPLDVFALPSENISTDTAKRVYGPVYRGRPAIDLTACALFVSRIGAKKLHDALTTDTALPELYFFSEPIIDFYKWEYGEGSYD